MPSVLCSISRASLHLNGTLTYVKDLLLIRGLLQVDFYGGSYFMETHGVVDWWIARSEGSKTFTEDSKRSLECFCIKEM